MDVSPRQWIFSNYFVSRRDPVGSGIISGPVQYLTTQVQVVNSGPGNPGTR